MPKTNIFLGNTPLTKNNEKIMGEYVFVNNEKFYKIWNYDQMPPFFISLVSHTDHWLFTSSNGGLTAGRSNANNAIFPYYTEDKLTSAANTTGSKTIFKIYKDDKIYLWEPFSHGYNQYYEIRRNLYKNRTGNIIIFEEINMDLQIKFSYSWQFSDKFGIIKKSTVSNIDDAPINIEFIDGFQSIVPHGVSSDMQSRTSNLVNAYKRNELHSTSGIGIFALSAIIIDRAEPSEALKATTVWCSRKRSHTLLSDRQLDKFIKDESIETEKDIKADTGSYFIHDKVELIKNDEESWYFAAEVNQSHADISTLIEKLQHKKELINELEKDILDGTRTLKKLVGKADGLQLSADELMTGRHYSNVLFNIMRGGIFEDNYMIEKADFIKHCQSFNRPLFDNHKEFFDALDDIIDYQVLLSNAIATDDKNIIRITYEYLPLTFSRRHGDPSRPWNQFSIPGKDKNGKNIKNYQGNWRDIFQNWEALALSFPEYLTAMITKFVNASTIDGYNPYRITRYGIDWEVVDPDDPWAYIGYWGDHQIIYLLKLMELVSKFDSQKLHNLLSEQVFVYANVPYRIKNYKQIIENPKDTIIFRADKHKTISEKAEEIGADGKLVFDHNNNLIKANLTEKLLVSLLTKFTNFIPEAGIWLNTQRPEWNDANNALVGNGVSMVTLYYMRRYVAFCLNIFAEQEQEAYILNRPVVDMLNGIHEVFEHNQQFLESNFDDTSRRKMVDDLGEIGEKYRINAYNKFDGYMQTVTLNKLQSFLTMSLRFIDQTITANKRRDGLYHAYNLVEFNKNTVSIQRLYEMLEGQVAVLTSGKLSAKEALGVLDSLKNSAMYREDQYSYILYPNKELPKFLKKNHIPTDFIEQSELASALLKAGNHSIIEKDTEGKYHFNGDFHNASYLSEALEKLSETHFSHLVNKEYQNFLDVYEKIFNHKAFTGRSGTFFGYEGLGSIYWHMVSKLLLAVQENINLGKKTGAENKIIGRLIDHYYEIRAGIGINKSPDLYGAFPTDPYSHTPAERGAQQPGMTGQVKEDVLNRFAELGLKIDQGCIKFEPEFLDPNEFLKAGGTFEYANSEDKLKTIQLEQNELAFTYCQVPVIYKKSDKLAITISYSDGRNEVIHNSKLDNTLSEKIISRSGEIAQLHVELNLK